MAQGINPVDVSIVDVNVRSLADRWWAFLLRGIAAILFGVLLFISPGLGLLALVALFGTYALLDGIFHLLSAARGAREGRRWGWLLFSGIISIAAGVVAFLWPGLSAFALLMLIAAWAVVTGLAQLITAFRLRKHIRGEWLLALGGLLSIAFGFLISLFPAAGALAVVFWIGGYAVAFGIVLAALSLRLRSFRNALERRPPVGGMTAPV